MPTLYQQLTSAGCTIGNHYSDLHVKVCPTSRRIIERYCREKGGSKNANVKLFRSKADGSMWWEVYFAYDPFWQDCGKGWWRD